MNSCIYVLLSVIECPSCRKELDLDDDRLNTLPRNLALENVVIRYSEERSKSIRKSLSLESPIADVLMSPLSDVTELPEFPVTTSTLCELCEAHTPSRAAWYCVQCEVSYCHTCFGRFHPRRGSLAKHKVRQPLDSDDNEELKTTYCADHDKEMATVFCDKCKIFACHLCVCEGEGKHAGHKILAPQTATKIITVRTGSIFIIMFFTGDLSSSDRRRILALKLCCEEHSFRLKRDYNSPN